MDDNRVEGNEDNDNLNDDRKDGKVMDDSDARGKLVILEGGKA